MNLQGRSTQDRTVASGSWPHARRRWASAIAGLACALAIVPAVQAAIGDLDPTFGGGDGKLVFDRATQGLSVLILIRL